MGSLILVAWLMAAPEPAPAPSSPIELDWNGPVGCASATQLRDTVAELLGAGASGPLEATATVEALESGYRLSLVIGRGTNRVVREVEAPTCDELLQAAALIIAVAANPEPVPDEVPPAAPQPPPAAPQGSAAWVEPTLPRPPAGPPASPVPRDEGEPAKTPPPARAQRSTFSIAPELGLGTFVTSPLTLGVGGRVGWRMGSWGIDLGTTHWLGRTLSIDDRAEIGLALTHGSLRGCGVPRVGRVELPLCGGGAMGIFSARPRRGLEDPRPSTMPWGAFTASAGAAVPLTDRWALALHAEGLVPFLRPAVAVAVRGTTLALYRVPPVAGRVTLGVELRLP